MPIPITCGGVDPGGRERRRHGVPQHVEVVGRDLQRPVRRQRSPGRGQRACPSTPCAVLDARRCPAPRRRGPGRRRRARTACRSRLPPRTDLNADPNPDPTTGCARFHRSRAAPSIRPGMHPLPLLTAGRGSAYAAGARPGEDRGRPGNGRAIDGRNVRDAECVSGNIRPPFVSGKVPRARLVGAGDGLNRSDPRWGRQRAVAPRTPGRRAAERRGAPPGGTGRRSPGGDARRPPCLPSAGRGRPT